MSPKHPWELSPKRRKEEETLSIYNQKHKESPDFSLIQKCYNNIDYETAIAVKGYVRPAFTWGKRSVLKALLSLDIIYVQEIEKWNGRSFDELFQGFFFALAVDGIKNSGQDYYPSYMFKLQNGFLFNGQKNPCLLCLDFLPTKKRRRTTRRKTESG